MTGFEKQKIIRNLVTLEKCLILDNFLVLSLQRKIFSKKMLNDVMKKESPSLDYCIKLLRLGPDIFTQFIDILIETKQNGIMVLLLIAT